MARPGSRVRPLETPGNRRPREMIAAPLTRGTEPGLQAFSGARYQYRSRPASEEPHDGRCRNLAPRASTRRMARLRSTAITDDARSDVTREDQRWVLGWEPAFYAYARPEPTGLADAAISPAAAHYSRELADFLLPYSAVHAEPRPDDAVLDFYRSVYAAAADRAGWDRAALDRPPPQWP